MTRISTSTKNRGSTTIALLVASLVCLGVAACGSSSSGSSSSASTPKAANTTAEATPTTPTSTTPASTTPASTTPAKAAPKSEGPSITTHSQYLAVLECMRHNGIKLPPFSQLRTYKITNERQFDVLWTKCRYQVIDGRSG